MTFTYINQEDQLGLGHAISLAKDEINDEPFAVLLPDDLFISKPSCMHQLLNTFNKYQKSVIAVNKIHSDNIHNYGVISTKDISSPYKLDGIIENQVQIKHHPILQFVEDIFSHQIFLIIFRM